VGSHQGAIRSLHLDPTMPHDMNGFDPFSRFPKQRPPLPEAHRARYITDYLENRHGQTAALALAKRLEAWMHRQVARAGSGDRVLEIGAGTLNHLVYECRHTIYDVIEPFEELWAGSPRLKAVRNLYRDIRSIPLTQRYDRILSVAVLEHLTELPFVVARSGLLLAQGGTFAAGIPSEGSLAWYIAWKYGTGILYRLRTGLDYAPLIRHEHVNDAAEIEYIVRHLFHRVRRKRFPIPLFHGSIYTVLVATDPDLQACETYGGAR